MAAAPAHLGHGIAQEDLTFDGFPEFFLTSMADNKLQTLAAIPAEGPPQPRYSDIAFKSGVTAHRPYTGGDTRPSTAWHAQFGDVNNDGLSDLFVVKGNVWAMPDFAELTPTTSSSSAPTAPSSNPAPLPASPRCGRAAAARWRT